jgi:hypothetical protein
MPQSKSAANAALSWSGSPGVEGASFARVATLAISREAWEALGARFADLEDPIGGTSRIASGHVGRGDDTRAFGVLDHDEPTTFLLGELETADALMAALVEAGIDPEMFLEPLPADSPASLDERILGLERFQHSVEALLAENVLSARHGVVGYTPIGLRYYPRNLHEAGDEVSGMVFVGLAQPIQGSEEDRPAWARRNIELLYPLGVERHPALPGPVEDVGTASAPIGAGRGTAPGKRRPRRRR